MKPCVIKVQYVYATPTFVTEALCFCTAVSLLKFNIKIITVKLKPSLLLNASASFFMTFAIDKVDGHGLTNIAHHAHLEKKTKLTLY